MMKKIKIRTIRWTVLLVMFVIISMGCIGKSVNNPQTVTNEDNAQIGDNAQIDDSSWCSPDISVNSSNVSDTDIA